MLACFACVDSLPSHIALCGLGPGDEGTKFNGGAGPACRTRVRRLPPSALVEGRRAPSSTCSACNKGRATTTILALRSGESRVLPPRGSSLPIYRSTAAARRVPHPRRGRQVQEAAHHPGRLLRCRPPPMTDSRPCGGAGPSTHDTEPTCRPVVGARVSRVVSTTHYGSVFLSLHLLIVHGVGFSLPIAA